MLSYRIQSQSALRKDGSVISNVVDRQAVLAKNIKQCFLRVGDTVRFKKPRRNPVIGTVVRIDDDPNVCTWASSGIPMNIHVSIPLKDRGSSIVYGHKIVRTNIKKLLFEACR